MGTMMINDFVEMQADEEDFSQNDKISQNDEVSQNEETSHNDEISQNNENSSKHEVFQEARVFEKISNLSEFEGNEEKIEKYQSFPTNPFSGFLRSLASFARATMISIDQGFVQPVRYQLGIHEDETPK